MLSNSLAVLARHSQAHKSLQSQGHQSISEGSVWEHPPGKISEIAYLEMLFGGNFRFWVVYNTAWKVLVYLAI